MLRVRSYVTSVSTTVMLAAILAALAPAVARAVEYRDHFVTGINSEHWTLVSNQPLFTCDDSGGDVLLKKPEGGAGWGQNDFIKLCNEAWCMSVSSGQFR